MTNIQDSGRKHEQAIKRTSAASGLTLSLLFAACAAPAGDAQDGDAQGSHDNQALEQTLGMTSGALANGLHPVGALADSPAELAARHLDMVSNGPLPTAIDLST